MKPREFAALMKARRIGLGLTGAELARRIGTSKSAVHQWENGRSEPQLGSAIRWARALGLRLDIGLDTSQEARA